MVREAMREVAGFCRPGYNVPLGPYDGNTARELSGMIAASVVDGGPMLDDSGLVILAGKLWMEYGWARITAEAQADITATLTN